MSGAGFIDTASLVREERRLIESVVARELDLVPAPLSAEATQGRGPVDVVFRVRVEPGDAADGVYIVGAGDQLGNYVPNRVAMHDDGTHGDQRAGDEVWSYTARLEPGAVVFYAYTVGGEAGVWSGLDVPHVRRFQIDPAAAERDYGPVDTFGRVYMQADSWHTNATGYRLLAERLADEAAVRLARAR